MGLQDGLMLLPQPAQIFVQLQRRHPLQADPLAGDDVVAEHVEGAGEVRVAGGGQDGAMEGEIACSTERTPTSAVSTWVGFGNSLSEAAVITPSVPSAPMNICLRS